VTAPDQWADSYLVRLTARLSQGVGSVPDDARRRHGSYLRAAQNADGGFSGREGGSDLYYTGFGLRSLAVLDELTPEICCRAADYLGHCLQEQASVVDFFSLLYSAVLVQLGGGPDIFRGSAADRDQRILALLETFRTNDGGYGKTAGASSGSTYHTFLVALCYELLENLLPRPETVLNFIHSRQREDGGFVEIAPMRRSGTNPTAAAVGVLQIVQAQCDRSPINVPAACHKAASFLVDQVSPEGGLRANARAPLADLLSTFTGLWTLDQLARWDPSSMPRLPQFLESLQLPGGGFRGGLWDHETDVEYTFYGVGCLALLAREKNAPPSTDERP
jgi:geranylgeranyl transferase type-2 subunit beta